jgi:hypothetical protein
MGKIYRISKNYTKLPKNVPNGRKISYNLTTFSIPRPFKIYPIFLVLK